MEIGPTLRLYWQDDHCLEAEARVVGARENALAFNRTCFYPGGGGQPSDQGAATLEDGRVLSITAARVEAGDVVWHETDPAPGLVAGMGAKLAVDRERRVALTRYHTVLHVLNTIVLRDYAGWITGAQIGVDYSRIDFKLEGFSPEIRGEMETKVNAVLEGNHPLRAYYLPEEEFRRRPELLRTLEVQPPVIDGQVRVVEIEGFDAQACGGTHVSTTGEVGRFTIFRTENKGKINKRLYVRLEQT